MDLLPALMDDEEMPPVATASSDKSLRLFSLHTGVCLRVWYAPDDPGVFSCVKAGERALNKLSQHTLARAHTRFTSINCTTEQMLGPCMAQLAHV